MCSERYSALPTLQKSSALFAGRYLCCAFLVLICYIFFILYKELSPEETGRYLAPTLFLQGSCVCSFGLLRHLRSQFSCEHLPSLLLFNLDIFMMSKDLMQNITPQFTHASLYARSINYSIPQITLADFLPFSDIAILIENLRAHINCRGSMSPLTVPFFNSELHFFWIELMIAYNGLAFSPPYSYNIIDTIMRHEYIHLNEWIIVFSIESNTDKSDYIILIYLLY